MIVIDDVQLTPKRVPVGGNYLLRVRARDDAEVQYADTSALTAVIDAVNALNPSDYKDFTYVVSCRDAALILLHEHPTIDRQDEVDYWVQTIQDGIAGLEWREGTLNNPIPYKHLMSVTEGLYYSYKGETYRCLWSTSHSLTLPGAAPNYWQLVEM